MNLLEYVNFDRCLGAGAIIALLLVFHVLRAIIRTIFRVKPKPSPAALEEAAELKKVQLQRKELLDSVRTGTEERCKLQATLDDLEESIKATQARSERVDDELAAGLKDVAFKVNEERLKLEQGILDTRNRFTQAKKEFESSTNQCYNCKNRFLGTVCPKCGLKTKAMIIPRSAVTWDTVNRYLHEIGEWGDPANYNDNTYVYLPWPKENVSFTVGGIEYDWGRVDNDDDFEGWWAELKYDHPILGGIRLVNKINEDDDHAVWVDSYDDAQIDLETGNTDDLRPDVKKGIHFGLTALYLWLQNESADVAQKSTDTQPVPNDQK